MHIMYNLLMAAVAIILAINLIDSVAAASIDPHGFTQTRRSTLHSHAGFARRQATTGKRCPAKSKASTSVSAQDVEPESSTSSTPSSTHASSTPLTSPATSLHKSSSGLPTAEPTSTSIKKMPTSSKSSTKAAQTTASAPSSNGGRKVGLLWNNAIPGALAQWKSSKVSALYNWTPNKPQSAVDNGIEFIPMFWGDKDSGQWLSTVTAGYATKAIGMNEVNQPGQSLMSVSHGCSLWRQYMMPLQGRGYQLGSPSVSSAPSGIDWLEQMRDQCGDCWNSLTWVVLHYYGSNPDDFISYMTDAHTRLGKPIMVTEFAAQDFGGADSSQSTVTAFLDATTKWMDATPWIYNYFWFGIETSVGGGVAQTNGMMNGDGSPNALGQDYLH